MRVVKRDGLIEEFDPQKIEWAVDAAANEVDTEIDSTTIAEKVFTKFKDLEEVSVAEIHSAVEFVLMNSRYKNVARAYIEKRSARDAEREASGKLYQDIQGFLSQANDEFIRENANKSATVVSTHRDLLAGILSKHLAVTQLLPKDVAEFHTSGRIHVHDLDYLVSPLTNCLLVNYEDMLANGFKIGDAQLEAPKSIGTACTVLTQISQAVASSTYGGQTHPHIDFGLEPYVEKSYEKLKDKQKKWGLPDEFVEESIRKEVHDAMQAMLYQIQTLTTTNGQAPFQSITLGLNTSKFGRMITEEYLNVHMEGVGKDHLTPVFPKVIFWLEEGVNMNPGDPNYDLKLLAHECSAKRIYPDYCAVPKNREITGVKGLPTSSMGCVDAEEVITYKIGGNLYVESFIRFWNRLEKQFKVEVQDNGTDNFIVPDGLSIFDSNKNDFVTVKTVIRNTSNDWYKVKLRGGRTLLCTADHPLPTQRGRVFVNDLRLGDIVPVVPAQYTEETSHFDEDYAWLLGMILCDGCYPNTLRISIAGIGEDDIEKKVYSTAKQYLDLDMKTVIQTRKGTTNYKDIVCFGGSKGVNKKLETLFGGKQKKFRQIPNEVFTWNESAKFAFLAGIVDADGYVNNSGNGYARVQVGSTNKELAIQQMLLANSLGLDAKMYENRYSSYRPNSIRYRVEFNAVEEFVDNMVCEKKKSKIKPVPCSKTPTGVGEVYSIEKQDLCQFSYDVETESDRFDVSGINSHNCRSYLSAYKDESGKEITAGRFNLGVCSINLPFAALEAKRDGHDFYEVLEDYAEMTYKAHMFRVDRLKGTKAKQNPIMWMEGAIARLDPENTIDHLFYNGYASISVGYIGLWECCEILGDNSKEKAMEVLKFLKSKCEEFKSRSSIAFSLYGTPSESFCYKAANTIKKEFGEDCISHTYLTNSFHLPVWEKVSCWDKWGYEAGFADISTGGNISYVESPSLINNLPAYEGLINYAYHSDMHYFAINTPVDQCLACGYHGEIEATQEGYKCPHCGTEDPRQLVVIRRTSGYISSATMRPFNKGKKDETMQRVKHRG